MPGVPLGDQPAGGLEGFDGFDFGESIRLARWLKKLYSIRLLLETCVLSWSERAYLQVCLR